MKLILAAAMILFSTMAHAHKYETAKPEQPTWGSCTTVNGITSGLHDCAPQDSPTQGVCDTYASNGSPWGSQESTWETCMNNTTATLPRICAGRFRNRNNALSNDCVGRTRLCNTNQIWSPGSVTDKNNGGRCDAYTSPELCDNEHMVTWETIAGVEVPFCVDNPPCPGDGQRNHTTGLCEDPIPECDEGETYNTETEQCEGGIPECDEGEVYDLDTEQCEPLPEECTPPNTWVPALARCAHPDCPPGEEMTPVVVSPGAPPVMLCRPPENELPDNPDCNVLDPPVSYAENTPICASEQDECDGVGGVIIVLPDGTKECFPLQPPDPEDPDPLPPEPKCPSSDYVVWDLDIGDFVCRPKSADPTDIPGITPRQEPDTDNDGTPDRDDDDIDGDGIPNGSDPDIDGDGIANGDDRTPNGDTDETAKGESSVSGGGKCAAVPKCTGDAVECAILHQTFKTRCAAEDMLQSTDKEADDYIDSESFLDSLEDGYDDIEEKMEIGDDETVDGDADNLGNLVIGKLPEPGSCSDLTFNVMGETMAITCAKTQPIRDILGWFFYMLSVYMVFQIAVGKREV